MELAVNTTKANIAKIMIKAADRVLIHNIREPRNKPLGPGAATGCIPRKLQVDKNEKRA